MGNGRNVMRYCYKCNRYIQFENLFSFPKLVYFLKSVKWNKFGIKKFPACNVCIVLYLIRLIYGPYSAYIANVIHSKDSYISNSRGWPWTDFVLWEDNRSMLSFHMVWSVGLLRVFLCVYLSEHNNNNNNNNTFY